MPPDPGLMGEMFKVLARLAWYDNEWGFSCMLDTARAMFERWVIRPRPPVQGARFLFAVAGLTRQRSSCN